MKAIRHLSSQLLFKWLLALNGMVTVIVFFAFRGAVGGDARSYFSLADGILHGNYSMWWFLPTEVPDTFRNPGYPLFLTPFRYLSSGVLPVQIAQLLLYFGAVLLTLRIIARLGGSLAARNLFLLILLPSINVPYLITGIFPEVLTMFLVCTFIWMELTLPDSWRKAILLALIAGAAFQMRSSLLLFPLFWALPRLVLRNHRTQRWNTLLFLGSFCLTMVPYGVWNYRHHGVFKPTPIEGGAGVAHMGWWSGKLPGYTEHWYWGNRSSTEILQFTQPDSVQQNIHAFNREWSQLTDSIHPLLTAVDSMMLDSSRAHPGLFKTFNTAFTSARERLLWKATLGHVRSEPWYTLRYKGYSAIRLWVTGIPVDAYRNATLTGKVVLIYPFGITLLVFLLALVVVPFSLWKDHGLARSCLPLLIWLAYFGIIHIPFVIQARYTAPVRLVLFALIAVCAERLWAKKDRSRGRELPV